ncbi:hypothetical protein AMS68_006175 [Peltaster fructicola]|uniref:Mediator of RNA polymerase II transcription subunit 9 n=1 Tax=Peltaster fructicola TaxID=286661 RepID=A0A6H0Y1D3_9PEZI|nr:hypothetical protein AMS68_006175 [Peltaster fructicola]
MQTPTTSTANRTTSQPNLPRADAFDVLPALHEMLSRIDHQAAADVAHANITGSPAIDVEDSNYADLTPLEPRDLPNEILSIKTRIRRTLRELEKLPDMDRTMEQQEQEIEDMNERIQKQRNLIAKLAQAARGSG